MANGEKVPGWYVPLTRYGAINEVLKYSDYSGDDTNHKYPPIDYMIYGLDTVRLLTDASRLEPCIYHRFIVDTSDKATSCIEIVDEKVNTFTVYVNSVSWDDSALYDPQATEAEQAACYNSMDKSGDGTQGNPWRNLNYALEILKNEVQNPDSCLRVPPYSCAPSVRVVITGVIDYTIKGSFVVSSGTETDLVCILDFQCEQVITHKLSVDKTIIFNRYSINLHGRYAVYNLKSSTKLTVAYNGNCCPDIDMTCKGTLIASSSSEYYNCDLSITASTTAKDGEGSFHDEADLHNNATATGVAQSSSNFFYNTKIEVSASCYSYDGRDSYAPCNVYAYGVYRNDSVLQNCEINAKASGQAVETNSEDGGAAYAYAYAYAYGNYDLYRNYVTARNCRFVATSTASASSSKYKNTKAYSTGSRYKLHDSNYVSKETCTGTEC